MTSIRWKTGAIVVAIVGIVAAALIIRGRSTRLPTTTESAGRPDLSLRVNGAHDVTVSPDTPLILAVHVANHRATNAWLAERAAVRRGKGVADGQTRPAGSLTVEVGNNVRSLASDVRIVARSADGRETALSWQLRSVGPPPAARVALDGHQTTALSFVVAPGWTPPAAGAADLIAILEVPPGSSTDWNIRGASRFCPTAGCS